MQPVLFKKDEKQFLTLGLGKLNATSCLVTTERNGEYSLIIKIKRSIADNNNYQNLIKEEMKIKVDAGTRRKWQTFEINRITKNETGDMVIYADHIAYKANYFGLKPKVEVINKTAEDALQIWSHNLVGGFNFDVWSDITTTNSTTWSIKDVPNAMKALGGVTGSILDVWGGEYEFDNTTIRLHRKLGRKSPTVLKYGRNITNIEQDIKIDSTYTSVYPFAIYRPEGENEERLITLDALIIDSQYVNNYANRRVLIHDFSSDFKENEEITQEKLRAKTESFIKANNVGVPQTELEISYEDLSSLLEYQDFKYIEEIDICDELPVLYEPLGIVDENARVVQTVYDVLLERNQKIKLGTIGKTITAQLSQNVADKLDEVLNKQQAIESQLPYLIDGRGNRVWNTEPSENVEHKVGDVWFEKNGKYTRLRVWNGKIWEVKIDDEHLDIVAEKLKELEETKLKALDVSIEEANRKINENSDENKLISQAMQRTKETLERVQADVMSAGTRADAAKQEAEKIGREAEQHFESVKAQAQEAFDKTVAIPQQLENLIRDKNLVDRNTVDVKINEKTGEIERKLTQVKHTAEGAEAKTATLKENVDGVSRELSVLSQNTLDKTTYTTFINNEYKRTADRVLDTFTKWETNNLLSNKADKSQLSDYVTTSVLERNSEFMRQEFYKNLKVGGTNLLVDSELLDGDNWRFAKNSWLEIVGGLKARRIVPMGIIYDGFFGANKNRDVKLEPNKTYVYSIYIYSPIELMINERVPLKCWVKAGDTQAGATNRRLLSDSTIQPNKWQRIVIAFDTVDTNQPILFTPGIYGNIQQNTACYVRCIQLECGNVVSDWGLSPTEINSKLQTVSSSVSQLANAWIMQIKNGNELKTAINATDKGIRLKGDLIHLNGQSLIDNAVISGAMIKDGTIDSAKIGTLDASKANIINVNVNSLTGNKSGFIQSYWNAINSRVSITGNGIEAQHWDGSVTTLGADGLYHREGGTSYHTHYLCDTFSGQACYSKSNTGDGLWNDYTWVQLPSIYKNKQFKAVVMLSDTIVHISNNYSVNALSRLACLIDYNRIDYANARVPVYGYSRVITTTNQYARFLPIQFTLLVTY